MTNEELQIAIDSLLSYLRPPTSSYVQDTLTQLKSLYEEQLRRSKYVTEEWK